jgi:predicted Zn-dependent protease
VDPDVIAALEAVVDREPGNLPLTLHLAELLLEDGRTDEALRRCDAVLAIAPADPLTRRLRQRALAGRGRGELHVVRDDA